MTSRLQTQLDLLEIFYQNAMASRPSGWTTPGETKVNRLYSQILDIVMHPLSEWELRQIQVTPDIIPGKENFLQRSSEHQNFIRQIALQEPMSLWYLGVEPGKALRLCKEWGKITDKFFVTRIIPHFLGGQDLSANWALCTKDMHEVRNNFLHFQMNGNKNIKDVALLVPKKDGSGNHYLRAPAIRGLGGCV